MNEPDNRWMNQRRALIDVQGRALAGAAELNSEELKQQRMKFAQFVMLCVDAGFDKVTMIQSLLAGAAFLGEAEGISRDALCKVIQGSKLGDATQLTHVSNIVTR